MANVLDLDMSRQSACRRGFAEFDNARWPHEVSSPNQGLAHPMAWHFRCLSEYCEGKKQRVTLSLFAIVKEKE
jgi:hypothetical protein